MIGTTGSILSRLIYVVGSEHPISEGSLPLISPHLLFLYKSILWYVHEDLFPSQFSFVRREYCIPVL